MGIDIEGEANVCTCLAPTFKTCPLRGWVLSDRHTCMITIRETSAAGYHRSRGLTPLVPGRGERSDDSPRFHPNLSGSGCLSATAGGRKLAEIFEPPAVCGSPAVVQFQCVRYAAQLRGARGNITASLHRLSSQHETGHGGSYVS